MNGKYTMFKDQYGNTFYSNTLRELKAQLTGKVSKMYISDKNNNNFHVGYVIGKHWLTAFVPYKKVI